MAEDPSTDPSAPESPETDGFRRISVAVEWPAVERGRAALWFVMLVLVAGLLYVGWRYVGTVVMGLFVYYVTRPVLRRFEPRFESRTVAVALTLTAVALPLLFVVGWAFAILIASLNDLIESDILDNVEAFIQPYLDLTALLSQLGVFVEEVLRDPSRLAEVDIGTFTGNIVGSILGWVSVAVNVGIHAFIVLIIVFYLLKDDYRIARWARTTFVEEGSPLESYFETVDRDLHNVYFGNILNALLTGMLAATTYTLLNAFAPATTRIPEAAFLGLLVGAASLVPVVGIKLVTWPVGAYLLGRALWFDPETLWFPVVFFGVSIVIVDYIPDQLLRPYVSGRTLHVGAVMLAYTVGPLLFGWFGIFLAPLLFVATFEFGRILVPWLLNAPEPDRESGDRPDGHAGQSRASEQALPSESSDAEASGTAVDRPPTRPDATDRPVTDE
ncbi:AI-2E family transporter [Haloarcula marina]|uniref:AI-2E family transporter n=1 Tax=Haloarcula marina TaxID=2961574 RepID=UPI0020B7EDF8|nr:AI-2E family transporter [Halomicroarcula marina]